MLLVARQYSERVAGDFLRFGQGGLNNPIRFQVQGFQFDFNDSSSNSDDGTKQLFEFKMKELPDNVTPIVNGMNTALKPIQIQVLTNLRLMRWYKKHCNLHPMEGVIFEVVIFNSKLSTADQQKCTIKRKT